MTVIRIVLIIAIVLLLPGCEQKAAAPEPVRPVLSMVVLPNSATSTAVVGTVQPLLKTDFGFRMLGRLISRSVNIGDTVEQGQQLAAVDPFAAELAVRSALAELSNVQGQSVNSAGNAERQRKLIETGATTKATLDSAEQGNSSAQAAVARAQANLTKAREQLTYTKINADYAGVVTSIGAEAGQIVSVGQAVITVARPDIREAVIDVADDLINSLQIGTSLPVTLQLDPRIRVEGKVRAIAPQSDAVTRSRRIRITLDRPPDTFRLGTTITVLIPGTEARGFRLPSTAILSRDGKSSVWAIDSAAGAVSARDVEIESRPDGSVNVISGIEMGTRIVTAGVHHLGEGQKVRLEKDAVQ